MLNGCDNLPFLSAHQGSNVLTHKLIKEAVLWLPMGEGCLDTTVSFAVSLQHNTYGWTSLENTDAVPMRYWFSLFLAAFSCWIPR